MASRASTKLLRSVKGRLFSSAAAAAQNAEGRLAKQPPKISRLSNGMVVASIENNSPLSRVSVVVNAGPRFESEDNVGVTHLLRNGTNLKTKDTTCIKLIQSIEQEGAFFECSTSRENMCYTMTATRDHIANVIPQLKSITTNPLFAFYDLDLLEPRLRLDLAELFENPQLNAVDLLHQAAYRNTLGRSVYMPDYMVGKHTSEQIMGYINNFYAPNRVAIIGTGINHDELVDEANHFHFEGTGAGVSVPAVYGGGEVRLRVPSNLTTVCLAVEGPSLADKDLLKAGVLKCVMGTGPSIKYTGSNIQLLGQAVSKATSEACGVSCVNTSYTDGGLFGFTAIAGSQSISKVVKAAYDTFVSVSKGNITDKDVARAKSQFKSELFMKFEDGDNVLADLGDQALGTGQVILPEDVASKIDSITTNDVVSLAKRLVSSKPSMSVVGDLTAAPYLDELAR